MSSAMGRIGRWLARKPVALWVRATVRPQDAHERYTRRGRAICYVLERQSVVDWLVLQQTCVALGLPRPSRRLWVAGARGQGARRPRSVCDLERRAGVLRTRVDRRPPQLLTELIEAAAADATFDVDIVPVAVYWGRAPQKEEGSWLRLLLSENWAFAGPVRKFLTVLFNGRHTLLIFGEPLALREYAAAPFDPARAVRRLARAVRAQLRAQRAATIGPDLSHRRTLLAQVLTTRAVRAAVRQEMKDKNLTRREALLEAKRYADEIAANYSHIFVTFAARLLRRVWNRLYDGVELHHLQTLQQHAEGRELIYVPCHRSHMDYLLLSYIIYVKGFAIPHIAAGVNLNLPLMGRFLRKGGAFFLRRTFRGNTLYPVVFMKYLGLIMARGHSIEYFIEGGRSRTGRLLQPKTGMLAMTVRSYLRHPQRPVVFLPVYFGYERLMEGATYIDELSGRPKQKETVRGFLRTLPQLRRRFGKVHVSLGAPIALDELLQGRGEAGMEPRALSALIDELGHRIMVNVNEAAVVTPINLLAVVLLATPRQSMLESDLLRQVDMYVDLLKSVPYSDRVVLAIEGEGASVVRRGEALQMLERKKFSSGDVLRMDERSAVLATYFRNNVLHLFALPSLLACCFLANTHLRTEDLQRLARRIYPYIAQELFLPWQEEQVPEVVGATLRFFAARGLLTGNADGTEWHRPPPTVPEAMTLSILAQATIQTVERYYLAIALLIQAGSAAIGQEALVSRCRLMAERMALVYGLNAPEFFDPTLFDHFIDLLRRRGVVRVGSDNCLLFDEVLLNVARDAQLVLSEQIRHSILQVTHA